MNDLDDYWQRVRDRAAELQSDGCSGVPDFYLDCCLEHDIAYRTHKNIFGEELTKAQADAHFRRCMQARSTFGVLSPMSWWRWLAVRWLGGKSWE